MERRLISVASFYMGSEEQASKTTASSQAAQASPVVERCLSLALLAPKKSSLSVFACQSPKSLHETDEMDPLSGIIGVGVVDDDGGDDDDEDDEEEAVETKDISRYQKHSSSWARSMNQYAMRRTMVMHEVAAGNVHVDFPSGAPPHISVQADPELYNDRNLFLRSSVKRSAAFRFEVQRLWDLVAPTGDLTKGNYTLMLCKLARVVCPPPHDERILQTAEEDWAKDLEAGREAGHISASGSALNYDSFFLSMFELCDTWTETTSIEEYVRMVRRLIDAATATKGSGLSWKEDGDIHFDSYFSLVEGSDGSESREDGAKPALLFDDAQATPEDACSLGLSESDFAVRRGGQPSNNKESAAGTSSMMTLEEECGSVLAGNGVAGTSISRGNFRRPRQQAHSSRSKKTVLSVTKCNGLIVSILKAKMLADRWAVTKGVEPIAYDKFVVRFFLQLYGTRGVARRHLRRFISSSQAHANSQLNPRIYLFCVLTGSLLDKAFNPRLSWDYFFPAMRFIFPDPRVLEEVMRGGSGKALVLRQIVEKACVPVFLHNVPGGKYAIGRFKRSIKEISESSVWSKKSMVSLDRAFVEALELWTMSDALRLIRERSAIATLQRFFRRRAVVVSQVNDFVAIDAAPILGLSSSPRVKLESAIDLDRLISTSSPSCGNLSPRVKEVLGALKLTQYAEQLAREDIDFAALSLIKDADLAEIGLTKGARLKILDYLTRNS